jgi:hypothetical protein
MLSKENQVTWVTSIVSRLGEISPFVDKLCTYEINFMNF